MHGGEWVSEKVVGTQYSAFMKLKARELHRTHTCTPFNKTGAWTCSLWRPSEGCWLQGFPPHCTCFVTIILCMCQILHNFNKVG